MIESLGTTIALNNLLPKIIGLPGIFYFQQISVMHRSYLRKSLRKQNFLKIQTCLGTNQGVFGKEKNKGALNIMQLNGVAILNKVE